ncbi:MAG: SagB/ThcOx family dehydrogenase [Candidatus Omnitrophota bacterium]
MAENKIIELPNPKLSSNISLEEAISSRRSVRNFSSRDISWEEIGQLVWAGQGITGNIGSYSLRASPSAGALYPMELYVLTKNGLYHYLPQGHKLEVLAEKDLRQDLSKACLGQSSIVSASVDILICAEFSRVTLKYKEHGVGYVNIEAGHIAQNIHLQAVALGLVSVPIGAIDKAAIKKALSLPDEFEPIYVVPVGYPQKK